jgi:hypothetical protein
MAPNDAPQTVGANLEAAADSESCQGWRRLGMLRQGEMLVPTLGDRDALTPQAAVVCPKRYNSRCQLNIHTLTLDRCTARSQIWSITAGGTAEAGCKVTSPAAVE